MVLRSSSRRGRVVFMATVALLTAAPTTAGATANLYSYQGSNYSKDFNGIQQVEACDGESDSQSVHADYQVIGSGTVQQVRDGDGNNGVCGLSGVYYKHIFAHRAVEEVAAYPDNFGPWRYPS